MRNKTFQSIGVAVIAVPMLLYGASSLGPPTDEQTIVLTVGNHNITAYQVLTEIDRNIDDYAELYGFDPNDPPEQLRPLLADQVRNSFIREYRMIAMAEDADMRPTDTEITELIRVNEEFMVDGQFSRVRFDALVDNPQDYIRRVRLNVLRNRIASPFIDGAVIPPELAGMLTSFQGEKRIVRKLVLPIDTASSDVSVSIDEIENHYYDNADEFVDPEQVSLEYVWIRPADFVDQVVVDEELLREAHGDRQATAIDNEERSLGLVLLASEADAQAARAEVEAGAAFEDVASARSLDDGSSSVGGDIGFLTRADLDKEVSDAVFAAAVGDLVGPLESGGEWLLFKVKGSVGGSVREFDDVRDELVEQVRDELVALEVNDLATRLEELALDAVDDLSAPAAELGLTVSGSGWLLADADPLTDLEAPFDDPVVFADLFVDELIESGANSNLLRRDEDGSYLVVRVAAHVPETPRALEEVSAGIRDELLLAKAFETVRDELGRQLEMLVEGEDVPELDFDAIEPVEVDQLATADELEVIGITPNQQDGLFGLGVLPSVTGLPAYQVSYSEEEKAIIAFRIDEVIPGPPASSDIQEIVASSMASYDANYMLSGFLGEAGADIDITIDPAYQALFEEGAGAPGTYGG